MNDRGRVGRYRILGQLGQGGMGAIYLARSEGPGGFERLAVLKMIHEHLSREPAFIDMFLMEARIAARIHHPNVVTVYEIGEHAGRYFIAMDYIHGETLALMLSRRWKSTKSFPIDLAVHIVASTSDGLHQAHELCDPSGQHLGVIHRDVSPANVMIGYDGTIRVMDFGIAKASDRAGRTEPGFRKGKAPYMAPEQIADEMMDRRVDVFALGILLWEATVGKRLFKAGNELATISRIMNAQVTPPSRLRADYPPELERIVLKALQHDPKHRHPTARALAEDLRAFLRSKGRSLSGVDVESSMRETFPDRHATRVSMLNQASAPEPPTVVNLKDEIPSLSRIPSDFGQQTFVRQLDALIAEELADEGLDATAATPLRRFESSPTADMHEAAFAEPIRAQRALLAGALIAATAMAATIALFELSAGPPEDSIIHPVELVEPQPEPVTMSFAVSPATATIEVDGERQKGPLVVERSERTYRIRISAPGHHESALSLIADRDRHFEIALEKIPAPPIERASRPRRPKPQKPPDGLVGGSEL